MKVHELLTDESKWAKGYYAYDKYREPVEANDPAACCWCLVGALRKCYRDIPIEEYSEIEKQIRDNLPSDFGRSLVDYNDNIQRTFQEVKELLIKLDI